jgi:predicted amidohydrolase
MALIDKAVETAAAEGSALDLAVLPELCTTGTISRRADAEALGEEIPGATVDMFARKARDKNICIVLGLAERGKGKQYNSTVLIGPRGVGCKYRKVHLSQQDEGWAEAGESGFPVCDLPFARIGLLSGGDLLFPESAESLAKRGADLICAPALWHGTRRRFIWEARQGEQTHLAVANQWGEAAGLRVAGSSAIYGYSRFPEKRLKAEAAAEGDEITILRLSAADSREKRFLENIDYDIMLDYNHPGRQQI